MPCFNALVALNINWSKVDSYFVMVDSYEFAFKLFVSDLRKGGIAAKLNVLTVNELYEAILELSKLLSLHRDVSEMHIKYKSHFASLVFFLLGHWIPSVNVDLQNSEEFSSMLLSIIRLLLDGLAINEYPLGDKDSAFHCDIFSGVLIILQKLSEVDWINTKSSTEITNIYRDLVPVVCENLFYLLDRRENDERSLTVLLGSLFELIRVESGLPLMVWHHTVERFQIIPLLLKYFSDWTLFTVGYATNVLELQSSVPEQIMEVLLCFASQFQSATSLYSHGLMALFCNNALTSWLAKGQVKAYTELGTRSRIHHVWCLMVAIVSQMLYFLGNRIEFLEYSIGFSKLHQAQMHLSINKIENNVSKGGN